MKLLSGGIENVPGFLSLGKYIGIKKGRLDFAVIFSERPCSAAAVYTKNSVQGAPLLVTKAHLKNGSAQAIVINSGVANVCTGRLGILDAKETARLAAHELGIRQTDVLLASTGLIGARLPMEKIRDGMRGIKGKLAKESRAADAILTTDIVRKEAAVRDGKFTVAGIAKGSGMIHPNMATMLAFICTDAAVAPARLSAMLKRAVEDSFNMTTVDMDTSTSDMCIVLANGTAGTVNERKLESALRKVCTTLARKIAADGEGASKLIVTRVIGARSTHDARALAKSVVSSNLVKCALYGNDPNWGRMLGAMGNAGVAFDPHRVDLHIGKIQVVKAGIDCTTDRIRAVQAMDTKELLITIHLHAGTAEAAAFGCDMTEDYVRINAHYST